MWHVLCASHLTDVIIDRILKTKVARETPPGQRKTRGERNGKKLVNLIEFRR